MLSKSSVLRNWKHRRWKNFKFYSTHHQKPQISLSDIVSLNISITKYSKSGELENARKVFDEMSKRTVVSWNTMISGYSKWGKLKESLDIVSIMHRSGMNLNETTFSSVFSVCGRLQSLYVAAWTSLINGYAHHGLGSQAISLFNQMLDEGVNPNAVTFTGLLSACARVGLVDEGMKFFQSMEKDHGVAPTLEHYACMVDLLGRSGYLREAEDFINEMPFEADWVVWGAMLSACWSWMDMEIGERVAQKLIDLDPKQISAYVIMSNIYAGVGKWGEVLKVRKRIRNMEVKRDPGCSLIEVKNRVHVFCVEDTR